MPPRIFRPPQPEFFTDGHEPPTYGYVSVTIHDAKGDLRYEQDRVHTECLTPDCWCQCRTCNEAPCAPLERG